MATRRQSLIGLLITLIAAGSGAAAWITLFRGGTKPELEARATVLFVDTSNPDHIYDKARDKPVSQPNCLRFASLMEKDEELSRLIQSSTCVVAESSTARESIDEVRRRKPSLLVIHRSTFQIQFDSDDDSDKKLTTFLEQLHDLNGMRVLIYSRKAATDDQFADRIASKSSLQGRVDAFQFGSGNPLEETEGNPFGDANGDEIRRFKAKIRQALPK